MIKKLTDSELHLKVKSLAHDERKISALVIEHLAELDTRRLYLKLGYPSMFEYLVKELSYSAGSAQRRIDAARFFRKVPEVAAQIEQGSLNLNQITQMQKAVRQVKKETGQVISIHQQKELIQKLQKQNHKDTELLIAKEFQIEVKTQEKLTYQKDESVHIEMNLTKEESEIIQKARELLSSQTGGGVKDTFVALARKLLKAQAPKVSVAKPSANTQAAESKQVTATVAVKSVTPRLKREIQLRDQCCQYRDRQTGKICGSKYFLEVDHIQPRFAGGGNEAENLRLLCRNHNQYRYHAGQ